MATTKIQNAQEVKRWIEEGRTYAWMVEEYERKYNLETTVSMFSEFRRRQGINGRTTRNASLMPWTVRPEHRFKQVPTLLRAEARRREGKQLRPDQEEALNAWIANLKTLDLVVHYEPDTEQGFFTVPRRPDIDTDLVRVPDKE